MNDSRQVTLSSMVARKEAILRSIKPHYVSMPVDAFVFTLFAVSVIGFIVGGFVTYAVYSGCGH